MESSTAIDQQTDLDINFLLEKDFTELTKVLPLDSSANNLSLDHADNVPVQYVLVVPNENNGLGELQPKALTSRTPISNASPRSNAFGIVSPSTTINNPTSDNNTDSLIFGERWTSPNISFSFTDSVTDYETGYADIATLQNGFQAFNTAQQNTVRYWLQDNFKNAASLTFTELTGASDRDATIRLAISSNPSTAFAYFPSSTIEGGDGWFGDTLYTSPTIGNYASITIGHELGHTLGLTHGHEAGGIRNVAMNADRDSMEFSIMTYHAYIGAAANGYNNENWGFAQTLMMYDIRAIQQVYGASFASQSGNNNYTFSTTTGEMFIDGVSQGLPGGNRIFRTVWDGNGTDTYDFSNYSTNLSVDLTPGGWSDLDTSGNFQRANLDQVSGAIHYARGHVFNALQYNGDVRSLIENVNGGIGNDMVQGNAADNNLKGNSGNDSLFGGEGADILNGGAGNDSLNGGTGNDILDGSGDSVGLDTFTGGFGDDNYGVYNSATVITENAGEGNDTVWTAVNYTLSANVETLYLIGNTTGIGNAEDNLVIGYGAGNNTISGGVGNDYLNGGAGNDSLNGGIGHDILDGSGDSVGLDTFTGGTGDDTYGIYNSATVIIENAGEGDDTVWAGVNYSLLNNIENLYLVGNVTGTGNAGDNLIIGYGVGDNVISGGAGHDSLDGGVGNDSLNGGVGNDFLNGGAGNDSLNGGVGDDVLDGSSDNTGLDTFAGGAGDDNYGIYNSATVVIENAGEGNDSVWTVVNYTLSANIETLYLVGNAAGTGNAGNNTIVGYGSGDNIIDGGDGIDNIYGGAGNDTFVLSKTSADNIGDFGVGNDKLRISASSFGGGLVASAALLSTQLLVGANTTTANTANQRFIYNSTSGDLFFDVDGSAASLAVKIGNLASKPSLGVNSFSIV
jgi:serralysin